MAENIVVVSAIINVFSWTVFLAGTVVRAMNNTKEKK